MFTHEKLSKQKDGKVVLEPDRTAPGFARTRGDRLSWWFPSFFFAFQLWEFGVKICPRTLEHGFGLFGIDSPSTTADALIKPKGCRAKTSKAKSSFRASSCSTILIVQDFLGTTFTSTSQPDIWDYLTDHSCLIFRQVMSAWEIFWIWGGKWSKHLAGWFGDETGGPDIGTDDWKWRYSPACHCWKCLEQPSHFTFYSHAKSRCSKMFLKFLINVTAVERALVTMSETSAIQRLKGVGVSKQHRSPKLQRLDRQIN